MRLQTARLNYFRLNNSRLNYAGAIPYALMKINGVWTDVSWYMLVEGTTVTQALNEVPDTATFRFRKTLGAPPKGSEIIFNNLGGGYDYYFAGHVLAVRTVYDGVYKNRVYECDCIDYTFTLNFNKVSYRYTGFPPSSIIADLIARFAPPGFTFVFVAGTPDVVIDEITFTNEEVSQAISRVCERGGIYWFADYVKAVRVFSSAVLASAGTITQAVPRSATALTRHEDLSPVATIIKARGGGAGATSDCAVGQTTIPVDDPAWYSASGGWVECGPQEIYYTGIVGASETGSTTGKIGPPAAAAMQYGPGQSGVGSIPAGTYYCAVSSVTSEGETLTTPPVPVTCPANSNIMFDVLQANAPTDPRIKGFYAYVGTQNGGPGTLRRFNVTGGAQGELCVWSADYYIVTTLSSATTTPAPAVSTAGDSSVVVPPGSATLRVDDLAMFPASGWAEAPGGQLIRYTGRSAASGPGDLTGIPASGIGAITAQLRSGTIRSIPHLIGIPASGGSSIRFPIKTGDEVYVMDWAYDNAAIANLQAWIGYGDGRRFEFLTDGRLSLTELRARAAALLAYRKDPAVTVTFETRDPAVVVGRTITFNTTEPPITGTFLIQRVQISEFPGRAVLGLVQPKRVVEASSRRFTFDDLVQQIKLLGRIN